MKPTKLLLIAVLPLSFAAWGQESSLSDLLKKVEEGRSAETAESRQREQRFAQERGRQQQLLAEARAERTRLENRSEQLETEFEENEITVVEKQDALNKRLGSLKELFGVLQQVAGDTRGGFDNSITSAQFTDRGEFLTALAQKMGTSSQLATIEEIERLWFEIQREMTESGNVVKFRTEVTAADGQTSTEEVVRVGVFNLVSNNRYLRYSAETGNVSELARQPQTRFVDTTSDIMTASTGLTQFGLDPTRGSLLSLLIQAPSLRERIDQGGLVGYLIIALGVLGLLLSLERLAVLSLIGGRVNRQLKSETISDDNPLGRVMKVYDENPRIDTDSLEVKMGEAILKEMPKLARGVTFLKIIAVVAPLMGLLGTVTGMIKTFQAITLFGTGDPKLMAGGISQALVTTVLGLCVAIPIVLLHTVVNGRSRRIVHVLQEQSAGLIAAHMERTRRPHNG